MRITTGDKMSNWYKTYKYAQDHGVYGYWISPQGEAIDVYEEAHLIIGREIINNNQEIINTYLKNNNKPEMPLPIDLNTMKKITRSSEDVYNILLDSGWIRTVHPIYGDEGLSIDANVKYTEQQKKILINIIESTDPKKIFFSGKFMQFKHGLNKQEAISVITGKELVYNSPFTKFR